MTQEHFEVQHYTLVDGWVNCWTTYNENDDETPTTYETLDNAIFDLDDMFTEIDYEITAGFRDADTGYSDSEYRIVRIVDGTVAEIFSYEWKRKADDI